MSSHPTASHLHLVTCPNAHDSSRIFWHPCEAQCSVNVVRWWPKQKSARLYPLSSYRLEHRPIPVAPHRPLVWHRVIWVLSSLSCPATPDRHWPGTSRAAERNSSLRRRVAPAPRCATSECVTRSDRLWSCEMMQPSATPSGSMRIGRSWVQDVYPRRRQQNLSLWIPWPRVAPASPIEALPSHRSNSW